MKRQFLSFMSILLILVCIFSMVAAGLGVKDCLDIKAYKEADAEAAQVVGELEDAIMLLKENEQAYADGLVKYRQGLKDYAAGKAQLSDGQRQIDENTQAYNEGKETLASIEPILPYVEQYMRFRDGTIAKLPDFDTVQAWFAAVVRPLGAKMGLTLPDDVTDLPAYIQSMVVEGKAKLKEYEDGLAALQSGKAQLADGAAQLSDGRAKLDEFEDGMTQVNGYTMLCFKNKDICRHSGELAVAGPEKRLGSDFSWIKTDENGNEILMLNGEPYLDLDKCLIVCQSFRDSVAEHGADVAHELYMRLGLYAGLAVFCILGMIAGILGLRGKGAVMGLITAVGAVAANVFGYCTRYLGYTYPVRVDAGGLPTTLEVEGGGYVYSGTLQLEALIAFAVIVILFTIAAFSVKKKKA